MVAKVVNRKVWLSPLVTRLSLRGSCYQVSFGGLGAQPKRDHFSAGSLCTNVEPKDRLRLGR